jgi:hypothetical protein
MSKLRILEDFESAVGQLRLVLLQPAYRFTGGSQQTGTQPRHDSMPLQRTIAAKMAEYEALKDEI